MNNLLSKSETITIKGFAILFVVFSHIMYIFSLPQKIEIILHPLGYLGVSLFLAVSGYGCMISFQKNQGNRFLFLKNRILNIVPILAIITLVFTLISSMLYGVHHNLLDVIFNMGGIQ